MTLPGNFGRGPGTAQAAAIVRDDLTIESASALFAQWCGRREGELAGVNLPDLLDLSGAGADGSPFPVTTKSQPRQSLLASILPVQGGPLDGRLVIVLGERDRTMRAVIRPSEENAATDFTSTLVKGLAHKMNNILTIFHGYSSIYLAEEGVPEDIREALAEIKRGAESASELLDRTVATARRTRIDVVPVPLGPIFEGIPQLLGRHLKSGVHLDIAPISRGTGSPLVDVGRLKTILFELLRNAMEAVPEEGTVRLRAETITPPGARQGRILIEVTDNGPGMKNEILERAFEPFFSTKKDKGCFGLGLNLARSLVEQMNGSLEIDSGNDGVSARIILPRAN